MSLTRLRRRRIYSNGGGCIPTAEVLEIVSIVKDALAVLGSDDGVSIL
jgi:hypothetical protein